MHPYADKEWRTLPRVIITSEIDWGPTCLDYEGQLGNEEWFDAQSSFPDGPDSKLLNEHGEHRNISDYHDLHVFDAKKIKEDSLGEVINSVLSFNNVRT